MQFRLETALKLHGLHFMCFLLAEVDMLLMGRDSNPFSLTLALDMATVILGGVVIPIIIAIIMEVRSCRLALMQCGRHPAQSSGVQVYLAMPSK